MLFYEMLSQNENSSRDLLVAYGIVVAFTIVAYIVRRIADKAKEKKRSEK